MLEVMPEALLSLESRFGPSGQELRTFATVFPLQPLLKELATSAMTAARSMPERTGMRTTICSLLQRTEGGRALYIQEIPTSVVAEPHQGCLHNYLQIYNTELQEQSF